MWFVRFSRIKVKIQGLDRSAASISWHTSLFILNVGVGLIKRQPNYITLLFFYNLSCSLQIAHLHQKAPSKTHSPLLPCFSCICLAMSSTDSQQRPAKQLWLDQLEHMISSFFTSIGFPWWCRQERVCLHYSSILAWERPRTEEPGGLKSMVTQRVGQDRVTNTFTFFIVYRMHQLLFLCEIRVLITTCGPMTFI